MLFASPASNSSILAEGKGERRDLPGLLAAPICQTHRPTDLHLPQEFMGCPAQKRVEAARITGRETEKRKIIQSSDYFGTAITHAHLIGGVSPTTLPIHHDGEGPHLCCVLILPGLHKGEFSEAPGEPTKAKLGPRTGRGVGREEQMRQLCMHRGLI